MCYRRYERRAVQCVVRRGIYCYCDCRFVSYGAVANYDRSFPRAKSTEFGDRRRPSKRDKILFSSTSAVPKP